MIYNQDYFENIFSLKSSEKLGHSAWAAKNNILKFKIEFIVREVVGSIPGAWPILGVVQRLGRKLAE